MKKEWKELKLEVLDIEETMGSWKGDSWDGNFIGREYKQDEKEPDIS